MSTAFVELTAISSMATRQVLADLTEGLQERTGIRIAIESVGGVDAVKRVQAGEPFDAVFLAADAIDKLITAGKVQSGSRVDLVKSGVAVAVRKGAAQPDISTEAAVREAVRRARSVSYSTGPSGVALAEQFVRWGIADEIKSRLVTAPAGVPVGALVARGEVELGFQQLAELMFLDGITVVGMLPASIQIITTFSAGIGAGCLQVDAVRKVLADLNSERAATIKQRNGMEPA